MKFGLLNCTILTFWTTKVVSAQKSEYACLKISKLERSMKDDGRRGNPRSGAA